MKSPKKRSFKLRDLIIATLAIIVILSLPPIAIPKAGEAPLSTSLNMMPPLKKHRISSSFSSAP